MFWDWLKSTINLEVNNAKIRLKKYKNTIDVNYCLLLCKPGTIRIRPSGARVK